MINIILKKDIDFINKIAKDTYILNILIIESNSLLYSYKDNINEHESIFLFFLRNSKIISINKSTIIISYDDTMFSKENIKNIKINKNNIENIFSMYFNIYVVSNKYINIKEIELLYSKKSIELFTSKEKMFISNLKFTENN